MAKIQLTREEAELYSGNPVVSHNTHHRFVAVLTEFCRNQIVDTKTGFYMGPPVPGNIIKCAIHRKGYTYRAQESNPNSKNDEASINTGVSVPRTALTPGAEDGFIPLEMVKLLRERLSWVYPELGKRDFVSTRLCWYLDTPDGDWLIDWHPKKKSLLFATAGCGHAFKASYLIICRRQYLQWSLKFFPNIGREIVNKIEGTLAPELEDKWQFDGRHAGRAAGKTSDLRGGPKNERPSIKIEELATAPDLKADRFAS